MNCTTMMNTSQASSMSTGAKATSPPLLLLFCTASTTARRDQATTSLSAAHASVALPRRSFCSFCSVMMRASTGKAVTLRQVPTTRLKASELTCVPLLPALLPCLSYRYGPSLKVPTRKGVATLQAAMMAALALVCLILCRSTSRPTTNMNRTTPIWAHTPR